MIATWLCNTNQSFSKLQCSQNADETKMTRERLPFVNMKNTASTLLQYHFNLISPPKYFLWQMRTTFYVNMGFFPILWQSRSSNLKRFSFDSHKNREFWKTKAKSKFVLKHRVFIWKMLQEYFSTNLVLFSKPKTFPTNCFWGTGISSFKKEEKEWLSLYPLLQIVLD